MSELHLAPSPCNTCPREGVKAIRRPTPTARRAMERLSKTLPVLALVGALLATMLSPAPADAQSGHLFPRFDGPTDLVFEPTALTWNPTNEWIFPTVIRAADHVANPLGAYYLYASPHNAPGGVSLFYADSPSGPWTPYNGGHPVLANTIGVTHISSPHVTWNPSFGQFIMYYHGENTQTRYAASTDGINWNHGNVIVTSSPGMAAASYARVFQHPITRGGVTYSYVMLYTEEHPSSTGLLRIRYAVSHNGIHFVAQRDSLVAPSGIEGRRISSPTLHLANGTAYVLYHAESGNIHATEVGLDLRAQNHLGVIFDQPERVASPTLITEGDQVHLFYESGDRLAARIRHTQTSTANLAGVLQGHSGTYAQGYFGDVAPSSHYNDVYTLDRHGITTGYANNPQSFAPLLTITRAELAAFLVRAMDLPHAYGSSAFADVPPGTFYTGPVEALRLAGITGGTHFRPNDPVTRQEMAVFLGRARGLTPAAGNYFIDVPQGTAFTGWIYAVYYAGITTGWGGTNQYNPLGHVNRQQMASFIVRTFQLS